MQNLSRVIHALNYTAGFLLLCLVLPLPALASTREQPTERPHITPAQSKNATLENWLAEVAFTTDNLTKMRRYLLAHRVLPGTIGRSSDGSRCFRIRDPDIDFLIQYPYRPNRKIFQHRSQSKRNGECRFHLLLLSKRRVGNDRLVAFGGHFLPYTQAYSAMQAERHMFAITPDGLEGG